MAHSPDDVEEVSMHPESQAELFHLVGNLIPEDQDPICVHPATTVTKAVTLRRRHNFSQLPVSVGALVLGVFSYRSLAVGLLDLDKLDEPAGDLPVDEFLEPPAFVQADDNWESIVSRFDDYDHVLVGSTRALEGILTAMDGLNYLARVTRPFVLLAEIEQCLRRIIAVSIPRDELPGYIGRILARGDEDADVPSRLVDMTFDQYIRLIESNATWHLFSDVLGEGPKQRQRVGKRLRAVRDLRNDAFHFKRTLGPTDERVLIKHRNWLQMKLMAQQAIEPEPPVLPGAGPSPEDYRRLLTRVPVPPGQRRLYRALYDAGDQGLTHDELVEVMGHQGRSNLRGVLGALGRRVNGTPGYGEDNQPGSAMVIHWEQLPDRQWRLRLKPAMRAVLEALKPTWLNEMSR
jgi:CBS domain-containing protein